MVEVAIPVIYKNIFPSFSDNVFKRKAEPELEEILEETDNNTLDNSSINISVDVEIPNTPNFNNNYTTQSEKYTLNPEISYQIEKLVEERTPIPSKPVQYPTAILEIPRHEDTYKQMSKNLLGFATPDGVTINWEACWDEDTNAVNNHEIHHFIYHFSRPMPVYQAEASADYAAGTRQ